MPLEFGNHTNAADQADGSNATPDRELTVRDTKQRKVVNDTGKHELRADNDGRGSTGTEFWDSKNGNDDKNGSNHTSSPGPPRSLGNHNGQILWWATLDLDQKVDAGSNRAYLTKGGDEHKGMSEQF